MAASVQHLFAACAERLALRLETGSQGLERALVPGISPDALVGPLNPLRPHAVQVLGSEDLARLDSRGAEACARLAEQALGRGSVLLVVADGREPPAALRERAALGGVALATSPLPAERVIADLRYYVVHLTAERVTVHGVFMAVSGVGILITGASGVGKSELGLELITRGHRLVADDAPAFSRLAPEVLIGTCPETLRGFLEVRGLGVLNVRAMYGEACVKRSKRLHMIVHLQPMSAREVQQVDRLSGNYTQRTLLDVSVPCCTLPVAPGRNLAVLVEAAVRTRLLRESGYDATADFVERQRRHIEQGGERVPEAPDFAYF
jgi:HPr kinase/phosphorylase